jgi:hypothetical protein
VINRDGCVGGLQERPWHRAARDVNTIDVATSSSSAISTVSAEIAKALPSDTVSTSSDQASEVTGSLFSAASLASNLGKWLAVAVLVAAFLLASPLTIAAVSRRVCEFGTLKALGWKSRRIIGQVILDGLDRPSSGMVDFDGRELAQLREAEITRVRATSIGFVFQTFNLVPRLSAQETWRPRWSRCARPPPPGGSGPRSPWTRSASATGSGTCRASCPAVSSSGWPSPLLWSWSRRCC